MHRYVGVLLALLAVNSLRVFAAGNIGCLFSDTLCEQEREWCFDDHAFGHCLSDYGHYREEDLHRYELGPDELRLLEQEMQRLFLLGYRWSHTYTQCVLQELLKAIRRKIDFDISSCNGDVDQDLEGALRAIEGEELVDPRDLAIVRFTPSATDPHSDYADEVYFPPIKDQLLLQDHSSVDHQDQDNDQNEAGDHQESPTSEPGGYSEMANGVGGGGSNNNIEVSNISPNHHRQSGGGGVEMDAHIPANPPGPPLNDAATATASVPSSPHNLPPAHDPRQLNYIRVYDPNDIDDYDDSSNSYRSPYHYQTPLNPVYRKRSRPMGVALQEKPSQQELYIRSLIQQLSGKPMQNEVLESDDLDEEDDEDLDEGVFSEAPTIPKYREAGRQFIPDMEDESELLEPSPRDAILSNLPQGVRFPNMADVYRNVQGAMELSNGRDYAAKSYPNLPEAMWNFPGGRDALPANYGPMVVGPQEYRYPDRSAAGNSIPRSFYESDSANDPFGMRNDNMPWDNLMLDEEEDDDDLQNSLPRMNSKTTALQEAFGPQFNSIRDLEDDYKDFTDYGGGLLDDYGDYGQYDDARLLIPDRAFPFLQKFDKKDEERAGGDYDEMVQPSGFSFQRAERLDVKKPGPGYTVNNFAFADYPKEYDQIPDTIRVSDPFLRKLVGLAPPPPPQEDVEDDDDGLDDEEVPVEMMEFASRVTQPEIREFQDGVLADEGIVDEATDEIISGPRAEKYQEKKEEVKLTSTAAAAAPTEGGAPETETEGPHSYVYITIDGRFTTRKEGTDLVRLIMKLAGLTEDDVENLSVDEEQVNFEVKENSRGLTASDVAKTAREVRGQVQTETGLSISRAGIGNKEAMSALVFNSSEKHILAAAAIVCGVMAALLVAASVLFFLRRHAKSKAKLLGLTAHDTEASKDYQDLCRARMAGKAGGENGKGDQPTTHAPSQRIASLSKDSDSGNNPPSSRSSTSSCEEPVASNMDISTGHMVLSYMEDHLKNKDRLEQEWIALCAYEAEPCATTLAMKPENSKKNRYPDRVPYDHNRVVLNAHANVNASDYINASSITDHDPRNPAYIATQGPLNTTAADFWQLVWEQGSVVIVMLTRLTENGLSLCHRYWPEEGSDLYHIYEVHLVSEHIWCDDYLVRSFYLKNVKTGETRTVTQFHFLSWPDSGTPASTKALLEFRRKVNKSYRGRSCPIIVHCSDGVGRTGTYSLIDMVLNRMAKGAKEIDIAATLEHIRDQRPNMVKSKAQFEFVLMAVAEEVHAILKALPQ